MLSCFFLPDFSSLLLHVLGRLLFLFHPCDCLPRVYPGPEKCLSFPPSLPSGVNRVHHFSPGSFFRPPCPHSSGSGPLRSSRQDPGPFTSTRTAQGRQNLLFVQQRVLVTDSVRKQDRQVRGPATSDSLPQELAPAIVSVYPLPLASWGPLGPSVLFRSDVGLVNTRAHTLSTHRTVSMNATLEGAGGRQGRGGCIGSLGNGEGLCPVLPQA